jgi:hypothetical protein
MDFRFIRQHPDGGEEVSYFDLGLEYTHTGRRIPADVPAKAWEIREVRADVKPPTIIAELVDDDTELVDDDS